MRPRRAAVVLFGDVIDARGEGGRAAAWLRALAPELDRAYGERRLARFDVARDDGLRGLLQLDADPFEAVVRAATRADRLAMRWVVVAGGVDPGRGPATRRSGEAFAAARDALERARARRDDLLAVSGDARADALMEDVAPLLADLLGALTDRQRLVARLVLVEGRRLAEVAEELRVSRATVSVLADRGRVRRIGRLAAALTRTFGDGVASGAGSSRR